MNNSKVAQFPNRMTQVQTEQSLQTRPSKLSLWNVKKQGSKAIYTGKAKLTSEMVAELQTIEPDQYGNIELDLILFRNNSDNDRAPTLTGYIDLKEDNQGFS